MDASIAGIFSDLRLDGSDGCRCWFDARQARVDAHGLAQAHARQLLLGHVKVDLQFTEVSQADCAITRIQVLPQVDVANAQSTGERRANVLLADLCLQQFNPAAAVVVLGLPLLLQLAGHGAAGRQCPSAFKLLLGEGQARAGGDQLGLLDGIIQTGQQTAALNLLARLEGDLCDAARSLDGQHHLTGRTQLAQGAQTDGRVLPDDAARDHVNRAAPVPAPAVVAGGTPEPESGDDQNDNNKNGSNGLPAGATPGWQ